MFVVVKKRNLNITGKVLPATKVDEIYNGTQMVKGYLVFQHEEDKSICHVLSEFDVAPFAYTNFQVVQGEFTGLIGTVVETKYDAQCLYYSKPKQVYLLNCGVRLIWVPVEYCRVYKQKETFSQLLRRWLPF